MKQISVFLKNEVGALAEITTAISEGGFNLRAFSLYDTPDFNIVRLITDKPDETQKFLEGKGFFCKETEVLGLPLEDRPGVLNEILVKLRDADIQVSYMYSLMMQDAGSPMLILATEQIDEAKEALGL